MANFIKDSANNYTLYIDQGAEFSFTIDATSLSITDLTNYIFTGSIKISQSSKKSFDISFEKNIIDNILTVKIPSDITSGMKEHKYSFDVFHTNNLLITRAFGGVVLVRNNITSV